MNTRRASRRRARDVGPYSVSATPMLDAWRSLASGVPPDAVAAMVLPAAIRRRQVARLRRLFQAYGAGDTLADALTAYRGGEA